MTGVQWRSTLTAAVGLLGVMAVTPTQAHAEDPYMWGVGGSIGTIVLPGRYPLALPSKIANYNFIEEGALAGDEDSDEPKRDLDDNGDPRFTSIERVRDDVRIQLTGFYGIDKENQIGGAAGFALGKRYTDVWFMVTYDRVLLQDTIDVKAGGGLGFGSMRFGGDRDVGDDEALRVPYFPLRGRLMGVYRAKTNAFGLGIFAGTGIPSNMFYTDLDGNEQELGSPANFLLFINAGLEFEVQFGDFTPPKKKKKKKKKNGNNGKTNGGGAGGGKKK